MRPPLKWDDIKLCRPTTCKEAREEAQEILDQRMSHSNWLTWERKSVQLVRRESASEAVSAKRCANSRGRDSFLLAMHTVVHTLVNVLPCLYLCETEDRIERGTWFDAETGLEQIEKQSQVCLRLAVEKLYFTFQTKQKQITQRRRYTFVDV